MANLALGSQVRAAREHQGWTRLDLALRVHTSLATITRLELEERLPRTATLAAIARELNLEVDLRDLDRKSA